MLLRDRTDERLKLITADVEHLACESNVPAVHLGAVYRALLARAVSPSQKCITLRQLTKVMHAMGVARSLTKQIFLRHFDGNYSKALYRSIAPTIAISEVAVRIAHFRCGTRSQQALAFFFYVDTDDSDSLTFKEIHDFAQSLNGVSKWISVDLNSSTPMDLQLIKSIALLFNRISLADNKAITAGELAQAVETDESVWKAFQKINPMQQLRYKCENDIETL